MTYFYNFFLIITIILLSYQIFGYLKRNVIVHNKYYHKNTLSFIDRNILSMSSSEVSIESPVISLIKEGIYKIIYLYKLK